MLFLLRPSIVLVFFLAAVSVAGAHVASRGVHARFDAARRRADADCRAYRKLHPTARVCTDDRYGPPSFKRYEAEKKKLEGARRAAARGDALAAAGAIRHALAVGAELDERGTVIGSLLASALAKDSLDIVEKNPGTFSAAQRLDLAKRAHIPSAAHPFEGERVDRLWWWALHDDGIDDDAFRIVPRTPFAEAYLADAMLQDDAILAEMDRAVAVEDVARCHAAARGRTGRGGSGMFDLLCDKAVDVVRVDARAKAMADDALRSTDPPTREPSP